MKKNETSLLPEKIRAKSSLQSRRRPVRGLTRVLVALLLFGSFCVALVFSAASRYSLAVRLPTRLLLAERTAAVDYQVASLLPGGTTDLLAGKGGVYISTLAKQILPAFHYEFKSSVPADLTATTQVLATLRIYETRGRDRLLFSDSRVVGPVEIQTIQSDRWVGDRKVEVDLAEIRQQAEAFARQCAVPVRSELAITLVASTTAKLPSALAELTDQPELVMPLTADTFVIQEKTALKPRAVWQWLPYQIVPFPAPPFLFPALTLLFFLLLVLWLSLTRTRPGNRFEKKLRQMQRMCRGRLMLIADKAWEPEWCITAEDFRTMVQTARKLKHPVFCHVDRSGPAPVAYFYVYYGENNYCLTFRSDETLPAEAGQPSEAEPVQAPMLIPTLPDTGPNLSGDENHPQT
jgi:hypothetical protein